MRTFQSFAAAFTLAASVLTTPAWAGQMYFNRLAGTETVPADTYGAITTSAPIRATAFSALTALSNTASLPEIGGTYTTMIVKSGGNTDTVTQTVSTWVKVARPSSGYADLWQVRSMAGSDKHAGYKVALSAAGEIAIGKLGTSDAFAANPILTTNAAIPNGGWVHLAVAITKAASARTATAQVFVNGAAVTTGTGTFGTNLNGNNCVALKLGAGVSAAGFYVDDTAISEAATIQALAVNETYNSFVNTAVSRTVEGNAGLWSTTTAWSPEGVPGEDGEVTLSVANAATLTVDAAASIKTLTVSGEGSLTFAAGTIAGTDPAVTGSLTVGESTSVKANTDVSAITASLGTVVLAPGKELTIASLDQISGSSGTGTLTLKGDSSFSGISKLGNGVPLKITGGTVTFTGACDDGNGISQNRTITVTGSNAVFKTTVKDPTGWTIGTGSGLILSEGGTFEVGDRDTFKMPVTMTKGKITFTAGTKANNRAFDWFEQTADLTVNAAANASAENVTESVIAPVEEATEGARIFCIRQQSTTGAGLFVNVAANARLRVDANISSMGSLVFEKKGAGELLLTGENTYTCATKITAGTLKLTGSGTLGETDAAVTVASGAVLEVEVASAETTKTLSNAISGAGTVRLSGAGSLDLHSALSETAGVSLDFATGTTGNLIVAAGTEGTVTVPTGATLTLVLSEVQRVTGYEATGVTGSVDFKKVASDGTLTALTDADGTISGGTFTPSLNTWEGDTPTDEGLYLWSEGGNWSKGIAPGSTDSVKINFGEGIGKPTLAGDPIIKSISITGTGTLNLAGRTLTANLISGEGKDSTSLTLEGTGTVKLQANTDLNRKTLEAISLSVPSGATLASRLIGSDGNAIFSDVAISFAEGAAWLSHGWLELAGTVSVTNAGNLELAKLEGAIPSIWGSGTLEKAGAGTLTINGMGGTHANPLTITEGTLALTSNGTATFNGLISGDGALKIASGTVALTGTNTNTYTGGTTIAAGATVAISNASALSTGAVSGSGTIETSVYPTTGFTNHNGPASISGLDQPEWQGTLKFTTDCSSLDGINFPLLCNANSIVEIPSGVTLTGYFSASPWTMQGCLKLNGTLTLSNGLSTKTSKADNGYTFAAWEGSGTFQITAGSTVGLPIRFKSSNAVSQFTGTFSITGTSHNSAVIFGSTTYTYQSDGRLLVDAGETATLGSASRWTLPQGAVVNGAIGGAATVNALTLNSGATLNVAKEGALTCSGTVTFGSALTVVLPETYSPSATAVLFLKQSDLAVPERTAFTVMAGSVPLASTAVEVVATAEGLAVQRRQVTLPATGGSDTKTLSEDAKAAISAYVETLPGITQVDVVKGTSKDEPLTADAINNALACFSGALFSATTENNLTTLTVKYDFGISEVQQNDDGTTVNVVAKVVGVSEKDAKIASGTVVKLLQGSTEVQAAPAANGTTDTVIFTSVPIETLVRAAFTVRAEKSTSN